MIGVRPGASMALTLACRAIGLAHWSGSIEGWQCLNSYILRQSKNTCGSKQSLQSNQPHTYQHDTIPSPETAQALPNKTCLPISSRAELRGKVGW